MIAPGAGTDGIGRPPAGVRGAGAVGPSHGARTSVKGPATPGKTEPGRFAATLREKVAGQALRWSRHAEERLRQAGVTLGEGDLQAITRAVDALGRRGAREGLVVYGDLALVVSVGGQTVITAARPERLEDGVFTQIDGAVIVNQHPGAGPQGAEPGAGEAPSPWID
ncbi:MAG TPA: hypothetical protein VF282_08105, partial [Bacillota bacterium]